MVNCYTVTFKPGFDEAEPIEKSVDEGSFITLESGMFSYAGHTLKGWVDEAGKGYDPDERVEIKSNKIFTAQWAKESGSESGSETGDNIQKLKKPFTVKSADGTEIPLELYLDITEKVSYNGMKHVPQGSKVNKSTADDIVVSVSGNILDYVDQSKTKIKVKNNKFVSASGKPAQVIISFKPNGKDKSIKKGIKEINKALKNDTELSFEIVPLDLSTVSNLTVKTNGKKTKVSKVNGEVMVSGTAKAVKLGKKDFTAEINADAGTVTLTGQGNCTGTATVPLS
ncbi:MAG: hypothetical protein IJ857_03760 [Lachnospiraceae bacterium]|nr:hypothetical protein [Lachnospiraceae bacterium]